MQSMDLSAQTIIKKATIIKKLWNNSEKFVPKIK